MSRTVTAERIWTNGVHIYVRARVDGGAVADWITVRTALRDIPEEERLRLMLTLTQWERTKYDEDQEQLPYE